MHFVFLAEKLKNIKHNYLTFFRSLAFINLNNNTA
ncbi:hypothetical protein AsAng_0028890 [Aureispira anguillae]|uniref:Uncharacterized protein n=1 Tax=Aureispira anguillae TaxID=2864201 RepID=A0A916DRZ2_9BACT|nr:hypothetical protein AsAng_0028890 [Aureispira anguillae]